MVEGSGREEMESMEIVGLLPGASVRPGFAACFWDVTPKMLCGGTGWLGLAVLFLGEIFEPQGFIACCIRYFIHSFHS